jgi:hypothetical protein
VLKKKEGTLSPVLRVDIESLEDRLNASATAGPETHLFVARPSDSVRAVTVRPAFDLPDTSAASTEPPLQDNSQFPALFVGLPRTETELPSPVRESVNKSERLFFGLPRADVDWSSLTSASGTPAFFAGLSKADVDLNLVTSAGSKPVLPRLLIIPSIVESPAYALADPSVEWPSSLSMPRVSSRTVDSTVPPQNEPLTHDVNPPSAVSTTTAFCVLVSFSTGPMESAEYDLLTQHDEEAETDFAPLEVEGERESDLLKSEHRSLLDSLHAIWEPGPIRSVFLESLAQLDVSIPNAEDVLTEVQEHTPTRFEVGVFLVTIAVVWAVLPQRSDRVSRRETRTRRFVWSEHGADRG